MADHAPGAEAADIAVVIVNYNGGGLLTRCLASVGQQDPAPAEIVVVDNASTDGSTDHLPDGVTLVRSGHNAGFGAAAQAGIEATSAAFVMLLNPDTILAPDCLACAGSALQQDASLGSVAPRVVQLQDPTRMDAAGIGLTSLLGQINWDHDQQVANTPGVPHDVVGPLGGASLWRRTALQQVGGWCADYFLYWEDMDLALRVLNAGYGCRTAPEAVVEHAGGGTVGKHSTRNVFYMVRNHVPCLVATVPGPILRRHPLALALAPLRATVLYAVRGRPIAALAGLLMSCTLIPAALRRRRAAPATSADACRRLQALMLAADENRAIMKRARSMSA